MTTPNDEPDAYEQMRRADAELRRLDLYLALLKKDGDWHERQMRKSLVWCFISFTPLLWLGADWLLGNRLPEWPAWVLIALVWLHLPYDWFWVRRRHNRICPVKQFTDGEKAEKKAAKAQARAVEKARKRVQRADRDRIGWRG